MKHSRGNAKITSTIVTLLLIVILVLSFNMYRKNYFNGFEKAISTTSDSKFSRDSKVRYSKANSYKIENLDFGDATFHKKIEVDKNTPYRVTCMVKMENVQSKEQNGGGVTVGLLDTTEYTKPLTGTSDWQKIEFYFNSKNRDQVEISFRLGGNEGESSGTAWFSDIVVEKGMKNTDSNWNIGCFIIKELDVEIKGKRYNLKTNSQDIENVKLNLARYKDDCYLFSEEKMNVNYEINEIETPVTTISYSDEHGYYISYKDVQEMIYEKIQQKQYDHVFAVSRMEDDTGDTSIPIIDNWIGLGSMDIYGVGYSLVRINKNANSFSYKYGITNQSPEEVYLHEFLHTLERNNKEAGYTIPALHSYADYGYTEKHPNGLNDWYKDYMRQKILDNETGKYIGLYDSAYYSQPANQDNFKHPLDMEFNQEPQNIIEEILTIIDTLKKGRIKEWKYQILTTTYQKS